MDDLGMDSHSESLSHHSRGLRLQNLELIETPHLQSQDCSMLNSWLVKAITLWETRKVELILVEFL